MSASTSHMLVNIFVSLRIIHIVNNTHTKCSFQYGRTNYGKGIAVLSGVLHIFGGTEAFGIHLELYNEIKVPNAQENRWETVATLAVPRYDPKVNTN